MKVTNVATIQGCEFQIDDATARWTWESDSIDYVHMRWLVGCIPDFQKLADEAYRCLKPGGWIEWYDFDAKFETDDDSMPADSACMYNKSRVDLMVTHPIVYLSLSLSLLFFSLDLLTIFGAPSGSMERSLRERLA